MPNKSETYFQTMKKDRKRQTNARNKTHKLLAANTYLADGASGGVVVVAWMLVLNPFAAFNLGGVTTLIKTRLVCTIHMSQRHFS